MASHLQEWAERLEAMKTCQSVAELRRDFGEPANKIPQDGFEIWHYPLGTAAGMLYTIHVCVWPEGSSRIYMHMEPA